LRQDQVGLSGLLLHRAKRIGSGRIELGDFIQLAGEEPPLRMLVIRGYAVAAHGHTRATFDVDFL
jgi:hypothetical protein